MYPALATFFLSILRNQKAGVLQRNLQVPVMLRTNIPFWTHRNHPWKNHQVLTKKKDCLVPLRKLNRNRKMKKSQKKGAKKQNTKGPMNPRMSQSCRSLRADFHSAATSGWTSSNGHIIQEHFPRISA